MKEWQKKICLAAMFLGVAFVYKFSFFVGIIKAAIVLADARVANFLVGFRSTELTKIFLWITLLGKWQVVLIFVFSTIGILWLRRKRAYIAPLLFALLGSEIFIWLGKIIFHRTRPEAAVYPEASFSFPSGHATIAVVFYGFLTYILIHNKKRWNTKASLFFLGAIILFFIGFSRLYLGVHYLSDVLGGYLLGMLWLIVAISISRKSLPRYHL